MANTSTQIYIHVVFAVEGRQSLIAPEHKDELQKYITGIFSAQKQKLTAINNMVCRTETNRAASRQRPLALASTRDFQSARGLSPPGPYGATGGSWAGPAWRRS